MAQDVTLNAEGLLLNWLKDVGEEVQVGDIIAEIEADKATVEIEAPSAGVLLEQRAEVGAELEEGTVIAVIGEAGEAPSKADGAPAQTQRTGNGAQAAEAEDETEEAQASANERRDVDESEMEVSRNGAPATTTTEDGRIKASPVARNIAEERGIDLRQVPGSGPGGRIVKADVENFTPTRAQPTAQPGPAPVAPGVTEQTWGKVPQQDVEIIEINRMRRAIADGTILSKRNVPHFYVTVEINVDALLLLRKQLNAQLEDEGIKISINDMIVKATALTLKKFPNLNSHYYGDRIVRHKRINVGISVALPNNGLINVVSHDADKTALSVMAQKHLAMYERAREGRVQPDDIKGATFTVSNLGPYDIDSFSAIISPPEAGIIAVGSAKRVPVVQEDGSIGVETRMKATISVDHRVSDGAEGAEWVGYFRELLENPMRLLV